MIAALVPAAGKSTRMGRPKLLLKLQGETVLCRVVTAIREGGASRVVVVVPPAMEFPGLELAAEAKRAGAEVVVPENAPAEMRDSVELGLEALTRGNPPERMILSPADTPGITRDLVARLLERAAQFPESIIVPSFEGRRGHPLVLPWQLALEIRSLPAGLGVNELVSRESGRVVEMPVASPHAIADLDTPDDLRQWQARLAQADRPLEVGRVQSDVVPFRQIERISVRVRLFALAKERAGRAELDLELDARSTVGALRASLLEHLPALAPLMPSVLIAVNEEYKGDDALIPPGARIAVIPPVSGGSTPPGNSWCGEPPRRSELLS